MIRTYETSADELYYFCHLVWGFAACESYQQNTFQQTDVLQNVLKSVIVSFLENLVVTSNPSLTASNFETFASWMLSCTILTIYLLNLSQFFQNSKKSNKTFITVQIRYWSFKTRLKVMFVLKDVIIVVPLNSAKMSSAHLAVVLPQMAWHKI